MDPETLARRVVAAYNSRELEEQIELFDPDVEFLPLRAVLEDTVYRGHDGVRQFARDLEESWSEAHIEILEFEVRGEQALSISRLRLKGRSSGALTEVMAAGAWFVRDGRVLRLAYHQTVESARVRRL